MSKLEDLERLARMLDEGKLTQVEYERLKAELLGEQPAPATDDPMAEKPPGWYDDPAGKARHQGYWDGQAWTGAARGRPTAAPPTGGQDRWYVRPRNWVIIVVGVIVLGAVADFSDGRGDRQVITADTSPTTQPPTSITTAPTTTKPSTTSTTAPTSTTTNPSTTTTAPSSPEAAIRNVVTSILGDDHIETQVIEQVDGGYGVDVTMNVSDNLTTGMIADGFEIDAGEVMIALYTHRPELEVQWVAINGLFPLTDQYGNTEPGEVVVIRLPRSEAMQVNWSTDEAYLTLTILPGIYEWLFVHPEMAEHLP